MLQLVPLTSPLLLKAFHTAFTEKYLSLNEVNKYNVSEAAGETVKSTGELAPRYVANILLGTVRIYGHQVEALYAAIKKELQTLSKPQPESFQAPKAPRVAATTLAATSLIRPSSITLSESVLQLEPVSVEVPRLQAQEADISFEEWQDASIRTSVAQSRSSDRITRSETFLHDLQVDQEPLINADVPDDPPMVPALDSPAADILPPSPNKENLPPKGKSLYLRIDPSTMLTVASLRQSKKNRSDILRYPAFHKPPYTGPTLTGVSPLLGEGLKGVAVEGAFKGLWDQEEEGKEEERYVEEPPQQDENPPVDDHQEDLGGIEEGRMSAEDSNEEAMGKVRPSAARSESDRNELSQRTQKMLIFLQEKLRKQKSISFAALTESKPAAMKASALYELLQLTQMGLVTMKQKKEFGDIVVAANNLSVG